VWAGGPEERSGRGIHDDKVNEDPCLHLAPGTARLFYLLPADGSHDFQEQMAAARPVLRYERVGGGY
jgi:hypothetical protein